jgi:hypothetical protein
MAEHNGSDRLNRIERALELLIDDHIQFREEHKLLLTAQVVLTERLGKLTERVDKLTERVDKLAEMGQHTDERLNALITVVAGLIHRQQ